jgi:nucleoside-diphosphate-sugar epimerase
MMEILLTGGTGLIGSRLVPELIKRGHNVTELQRYNASRGFVAHSDHRVIWYDMRGGGHLPNLSFDLVLHLAAMASNTVANQNPVECFDTIATGTVRLIEDIKRLGNEPIFVLASSSEVIGNEHGGVFAHNPYAAAKIAAEEAVRASGLPWVVTRPFNTYGRAHIGAPVAVIDKWIVAALRGEPLERWVNNAAPPPVRDFLWREDHVGAYLHLVHVLENQKWSVLGQPIQFGTGRGIVVEDALALVANRMDASTVEAPGRQNDTPYLVADTAIADVVLDWRARVDLETGIDLAIEEWRSKLAAGAPTVTYETASVRPDLR